MTKDLQKKMLEYIQIQKTVTTGELCDKFNISESSSRRFLQKMSDQGKIQRFHGGAIFLEDEDSSEIQKRYHVCEKEKESMAKKAAELIKPNTPIILLGGTTVYRICKYIKHMKLTVITNSMIVFKELQSSKGIQLVLLGGEYNRDEEELCGVLTNNNSKLFACDHLFFGAAGYIRNTGFTTSDMNSLQMYSECMALAKQVTLVFDSSKFEERGKAITVNNKELTYLITDSKIKDVYVNELKKAHVQVIVAD